MPINYKEYHPEWKKISKAVIKEAGDCCELCGAPNRQMVYRPLKKYKHIYLFPWRTSVTEFEKDMMKFVKVILTTHHIDGDKNNNSRVNLIALCQKCHLRLDLGKHISNRKNNKMKNNANLFRDHV